MNEKLQRLQNLIQDSDTLSESEKTAIASVLKEVDKVLTVTEFKLDRTEKVKKTTSILLEETIEELELKRKAIEETNAALTKSLEELQAAQSLLIQSEKMASLGELTAGIAHEIQNPLNFVNNFSEVSTELVDEMNIEIEKGNTEDAKLIAKGLKQNLEKINHHGKRAGDIVKAMLQHSRSSSGVKELTDINALADEYLRLAYHGLRAKDKTFNATIKTDFDESIKNINVIPQDIGRVILNLITNAFYAVTEKKDASTSLAGQQYEATVEVRTKKIGDKVEVKVRDNGSGIPQKVLDKIFQPFFTTKPTGQGTGLGLSLSYDIIKAHGGELKVQTKEGEGSEFIIQLNV
ncbi:MAG: ATP-binding protein [Ignavibacteria bacterium]